MQCLIKYFLNTKTLSHKVANAESKYREATIAKGKISQSYYDRRH